MVEFDHFKTTPMNNLTPLQEVAATLMAGMLANPDYTKISIAEIQTGAIVQAKALLEATKPEPLEWIEPKNNGTVWRTKCGQFKIVSNFANDFNLWNATINQELYPSYENLDEAKTFAEIIRTR